MMLFHGDNTSALAEFFENEEHRRRVRLVPLSKITTVPWQWIHQVDCLPEGEQIKFYKERYGVQLSISDLRKPFTGVGQWCASIFFRVILM
jgi:hypothetical protein